MMHQTNVEMEQNCQPNIIYQQSPSGLLSDLATKNLAIGLFGVLFINEGFNVELDGNYLLFNVLVVLSRESSVGGPFFFFGQKNIY